MANKQTKEISKKVELTRSNLEEMIDHIYNQNLKNAIDGIPAKSINIQGPHGLGKTSIVRQFAERKGIQYIELNLSNFAEVGDLIGYPTVEYYMCRQVEGYITKVIGGKEVQVKGLVEDCTWVNKNAIKEFESQGYKQSGKTQMTYALPAFLNNIKEKGILMLDDFTRAVDPAMMQAIMSLMLEQKTQTWSLPKGWTVIATSNPMQSGSEVYEVNRLDAAQADRYITFDMKFSIEDWGEWASREINGRPRIDEHNIRFMVEKSNEIVKNNSPRNLVCFFDSIRGMQWNDINEPIITQLATSTCGSDFATLYQNEMKNKLTNIPTGKFVMTEPNKILVKAEIEKSVGKIGKDYSSVIGHILCSRIRNYCMEMAKGTQEEVERLKWLLTSGVIDSNHSSYVACKAVLDCPKFIGLVEEQKILDMVAE